MPRFLPVASLLALLTTPLIASDGAENTVDFNRDIRPILSDKCFQCHGPDEESLKADLRLDQRPSAIGAKAILPGNAEASELIARILSSDRDEVMPPPKVKKTVTPEETARLRQWINQGAEYAGHWSFDPIEDPLRPQLESADRVKNDIDPFILSELEKNQLSLSPEAAPETLARRIALDLTGLLPTPKRVKSFVETFRKTPDKAVSGYADELLDSKHYGERWGRHWLDQARYADSNGYTIDSERIMWPYRDWVIRAVNNDMPFDQFTIEQIAGDLLPDPDKAQLIATGFHRNTLINQEGGTDDEQFRNEEMVDRVNTTGAVWLGLTLGCAQCHTHKFDPITHKEYFELFAFFNQGQDVNNTGATVEVSEGELFLTDPQPEKWEGVERASRIADKLSENKRARQTIWEDSVLKAAQSKGAGARWVRVKPTSFSAEGGAPLRLLEDHSILAGTGAPMETYRVKYPRSKKSVAAMRLRLIPHESLPQNGPGLAGNGNIVLTRVAFLVNGNPLVVKRADHDHAQAGFSGAFTIDGNPDTGWAINVGKGTRAGVKMNSGHEVSYTFAEPLPAGATLEVVLRHEKNRNYNIGRFAWESSNTPPQPIREEALLTQLQTEEAKRTKEDKTFLAAEFDKVDSELEIARANVDKARKALGIGKPVKTMVMKDLTEPRETFIHLRGDFLRRDEEVGPLDPGVPAVLPPLIAKTDDEASRNRLDLARWITRPDHPLTARVTVNRVWMRYFGKGIVETENDFGTQGSFPTHPELLDSLATSFVEKGWSMKALHKLIVTSATYRQSSNHEQRRSEVDPLNHLLSRQNRIRFDAEIVRDAALSASGLLSTKIGGPGVMPPQPEGVYSFTQRKVKWVTATGSNRFRRALYTQFYRSAPYPLLTTFDSPDFQSVCTSRVRSNTPLQSLTLANDKSLFEMAKGLGERLMNEVAGTDRTANRDRIRHGFALCYSRPPSEDEVETVAAFQETQRTRFANDDAGAREVAPENTVKSFTVAEAASWTAVARALMNTDEFITRE